jgi:hypothetical protein
MSQSSLHCRFGNERDEQPACGGVAIYATGILVCTPDADCRFAVIPAGWVQTGAGKTENCAKSACFLESIALQ